MKTVLITGASGGIGSAIAVAFAQNGYDVALNYNKNEAKAKKLAGILRETYGVNAAAVGADVSDRTAVNSMFDEIDRLFGNLDVLINNAGIAQQKLFTDISSDEWCSMLNTNLGGVFNCTQEALKRYMLKNHS